jgi:hypothetical protein
MDQIETYNPPPNPAKTTDSRYQKYADLYGDDSWELDALDPAVLAEILETRILELRDEERWDRAVAFEHDQKDYLTRTRENWDEVKGFLDKLKDAE